MTKHAVLGLTRTLANELAAQGSRVSAHVLCPGFLRTGIAESERNWPDRLGPAPRETDGSEGAAVHDFVRAMVDAGLEPAQLAERVVDAVATGRFFVTTHPEESAVSVAQLAAVVEGADPGLLTG